jgi:triosephosphate isomerase
MKNLIVANWKMNPASQKEAEIIFEGIKNGVGQANAEVVICPPSVFLSQLKGLALGAQNMHFEEKGAFTGEISALMLKDLGAEYVIIGHSERRHIFGETDEIINKKIKTAIGADLEQIFCVGETAEERDAGRQEEVVERQLKEGLKDIADVNGIVIAYEPVWAIGTGKNCGTEDAKKMKDFIASIVPEARIIYGGSVKAENSAGYLRESGYNGLLVGGSSLKPDEFVKIIKSAE